jgi:predicted HAD superfamily Cof-like phosphohydrolase
VSVRSIDLVHEFHLRFDCPVGGYPLDNVVQPDLMQLRRRLIDEEANELFEAIAEGDRHKVLQEITDLQYVLDGLYLTLGLHPYKDAAMEEVHRANMSKLMPDGTVRRRPEDGKVLKGPNFDPPDMTRVLP